MSDRLARVERRRVGSGERAAHDQDAIRRRRRSSDGTTSDEVVARRVRRRSTSQPRNPRSEGPASTGERARNFAGHALTIMCLLLVTDAVFVGVGLALSLRRTVGALERGIDAVSSTDLTAAESEFEDVRGGAEEIHGLTRHPSFAIASHIPVLGPDLVTVATLSAGAGIVADAAAVAVDGARALDGGTDGFGTNLYRHGRVRSDAMARLLPALTEASDLLDEAAIRLDVASEPTLPVLGRALATARWRIDRAREATRDAQTLIRAAPSLFGDAARRRYLLAFQSPSEARGSGGFMGLYGILEADAGRLSLRRMGPIGDLSLSPSEAVDAPGWFKRRYGGFASRWQWQQANLSGDFPTVAGVWLRMYRQATGSRLDGVIAMDPIALGHLTSATGPLRARGWNVDIGPDNAAQLLLHDAYVRFDDEPVAQNRYLARLVRTLWTEISRGDVDPVALAQGLVQGLHSQHLKMHAVRGEDGRALAALEVDGSPLDREASVQYVWHDNLAANKVDVFLRRRIDTVIEITQRGETRVVTRVTFENEAPAGSPSVLLGPYAEGDEPGLNRMALNLLLPKEAEVTGYEVDGRARPPLLAREKEFPVVWDILEIPAGRTLVVGVSYEVPGAVDLDDGSDTFTMTLFPQATAVPDEFSVRLIAPYEFELTSNDPGAVVGDGSFEKAGILSEPQTLTVGLVHQ